MVDQMRLEQKGESRSRLQRDWNEHVDYHLSPDIA
jgi:hypothetical protein